MASQEEEIVTLPDFSVCGNTTSGDQRIVGGKPADLNGWPWIAALGYRVQNFILFKEDDILINVF